MYTRIIQYIFFQFYLCISLSVMNSFIEHDSKTMAKCSIKTVLCNCNA